ncbi:MAG: hypothetical protein P8R54_03110 [Myxococcota bacterium]|nr:hypothetical protein [Myxococcota bacterium]
MVYRTIGAVMSMQIVLGCFHSENDVFDEVSMSDAFIDEAAIAIRAGIQPTALHDVDGLELLPTSTLVPLLPSSSSWLVGAGLVLRWLHAFDGTLLAVGWTDGTGFPLP